jgi:hypothetical protein
LAVAVAREARVVATSVDLRLGFAFTALGIVLLVALPEVEPAFAIVWVNLALLAHAGYAFNSYGLDAAGIDRLRLLPIADRDLVTAKNVTLVAGAALQTLPFVIAVAWRLGPTVALWTAAVAVLATLSFAALGNITSFAWAAPRDGAAGDTLPAVAALAVTAANTGLGLLGLAMGAPGAALLAAGIALAAVVWVPARAYAARRLARDFDVLRARLGR